jgi:hypothetical protein
VEVGPVFEDSIGAQFLTSVMTLPSIIKERHDTLHFDNHIYIRHEVRLVVAVEGLPLSRSAEEDSRAPYRAWGTSALQTGLGRVVVPLGDLDRHSRATTHITDENGEVVPLFTPSELNLMLGSGLVAYAARVLPRLSAEQIQHLRDAPRKAGANLQPAGIDPQIAADRAFQEACSDLLEVFGDDGLKLLQQYEFRLALVAISSAVQLVVALDPDSGPTRILSYSYFRPITAVATDAGHESGEQGGVVKHLRERLRIAMRYMTRSGSTRLAVDLGPVGGCERYQLSAEAPFDSWFASAQMERTGAERDQVNRIDPGQKFRLTYTHEPSDTPWSGVLRVNLMTVYTGVARASVFAGMFLALCAIAGTIRVILEPGHALISQDTDAAASLLLLFPGIAASAVAGSARNTLTATLQFPMRLTLWTMSLASFVLATAAAFRLGGYVNIGLWLAVTLITCTAASVLFLRSRQWNKR